MSLLRSIIRRILGRPRPRVAHRDHLPACGTQYRGCAPGCPSRLEDAAGVQTPDTPEEEPVSDNTPEKRCKVGIIETDARPIVVTAFGVAKGGDA